RSGPGHRRDRRGWRCTASEWLSPGVAFVQAVPVADLALAVFPAEVDLTPVAEVQEVDQAETDVLGRAAEFDDLAQPPTDLAGQPLDLGLVSAPGPTVENAAAGHGDPLLLGLHPLLRRPHLGVRRHHALHDVGELGDQRLHVGDREVALSHGCPAPRRSRALPWARERP